MMLTEQLAKMFETQPDDVKRVLLRVIALEQENISFDRPHIRSDIDQIVTAVASDETGGPAE